MKTYNSVYYQAQTTTLCNDYIYTLACFEINTLYYTTLPFPSPPPQPNTPFSNLSPDSLQSIVMIDNY